MKIAIVGASEHKWTEEQKLKARITIKDILWGYMASEVYPYLPEMIIDSSLFNITLISGHCHKGGVDIWAEEIAKELGTQTEIYPAEVHQWNDKIEEHSELVDVHGWDLPRVVERYTMKGYRSRNIQIAKACDVLYDIEPEGSCSHCGGEGFTYEGALCVSMNCKFCKGTGNYSGGTWTMRKAKKLGKEVHQVVVK